MKPTTVSLVAVVVCSVAVAFGCTTSGTDQSPVGPASAEPRLFRAPSGEVLVSIGKTLLKMKGPGGSGTNLFAIQKSGNTWVGLQGYNNFAGSQEFPADVRDVAFAGGVTLVGLSDGRIVKVNGTGGGGQNMFAIQTAPSGFTGVTGYPYYIGSHKFRSGIWNLTVANNELIVSLDDSDGTMLKVSGTGGSGFNLFAIKENANDISSVPGYHYYVGDQQLKSKITAVALMKGVLFAATENGKLLKVSGTGGSGHNMFAVTLTSAAYETVPGYNYRIGDAVFSSNVIRIAELPAETIVGLDDGRLLKVTLTGGSGHNMFAVKDNKTSFSGLTGYHYYVGDQPSYSYVIFTQNGAVRIEVKPAAVTYASGELFISYNNGKIMKVNGTGGSGNNMFAVIEQSNGFGTVSGYHYLIGSTNLGKGITQIASFDGYVWVTTSSAKLLKITGNGGSGFNMFAVAQSQTEFSGLCGYPYYFGSQGFA